MQDASSATPATPPRSAPRRRRAADALLKGGLKIYATLDQNAQNNAQNAVNTVLRSSGRSGFTSSLVAMDPNTGAVKAMVPGPDFAASQYNIATHPPGRQMGSTWKVVTLAAALTTGFSPNDSVSGASPCAFKGGLGQTQNAERGGGVMSIRAGDADSVNCAFAAHRARGGHHQRHRHGQEDGHSPQNPANLLPVLTLTLGTIIATPLEMATVHVDRRQRRRSTTRRTSSQKIVGPDGNTDLRAEPDR